MSECDSNEPHLSEKVTSAINGAEAFLRHQRDGGAMEKMVGTYVDRYGMRQDCLMQVHRPQWTAPWEMRFTIDPYSRQQQRAYFAYSDEKAMTVISKALDGHAAAVDVVHLFVREFRMLGAALHPNLFDYVTTRLDPNAPPLQMSDGTVDQRDLVIAIAVHYVCKAFQLRPTSNSDSKGRRNPNACWVVSKALERIERTLAGEEVSLKESTVYAAHNKNMKWLASYDDVTEEYDPVADYTLLSWKAYADRMEDELEKRLNPPPQPPAAVDT